MAGPASLVFTLSLKLKHFLLPPGSRQGLAHRRGHYHTHVLSGAVPTQGGENMRTLPSGRVGSAMGHFGFGQCTASHRVLYPGSERVRALASST